MKHSILPVTRGLKRTRTTFLWAALLCAALQASADTPTYYWDANGTDGGPGYQPDGVWAADTSNWTSDFEGNSPTFAYPGRADVVFAATGGVADGAYWSDTGDYTVTIEGVQEVSDIVIQDGNCTLTNDSGYLDKDTPYISVLGYGQTATIYSVLSSALGTSNGITKFAWGDLVLGGTNTYQGPTTIEGGTLLLAAPQVLPSASMLVLAGGDTRPDSGYSSTPSTFAAGGYSQTLGPLLLTGPYTSLTHTIDFGHGASALAFADSHTQDWGGILLNLVNFKPGVDSLRFGTNSSGLTPTQLGLIRFYNFLDVPGAIDAHGFVTPQPVAPLSIVANGSSSVKLTWAALNGRNYNIQTKSSVTDAYWTTNSIQDVTGANNTASFTDTVGTNRHRIYRVRLQPLSVGN